MKGLFRRLGLGRLFYLVYFKPVGLLLQSVREGGPINQLINRRGRKAMERAALELPPVHGHEADREPFYEVHVLTGRRFWYQTAFCVRSLIAHSPEISIRPVFYDDGTLAGHRRALERLFPAALFVNPGEIAERVEQHLPLKRFPSLRERREHYPLIRKLIDPHLGSKGWKLVLDSDMLFFRRPVLLNEWLREPIHPLQMVDVEESYGYSRELLEELADGPIPERMNIGICGLESETIDWVRIENWITKLVRQCGTHYLMDQALVAMMMSGMERVVAPPEDYITLPDDPECADPRAVMHHYVALSKRCYFRVGWRKCLARITPIVADSRR